MSMENGGWFKSSYSGGANPSCVEVRFTGNGFQVRDSKRPRDAALSFTATSWTQFLRAQAK